MCGTVDSVLIKEVSLFQKSLIERFHCVSVHLDGVDSKLYIPVALPTHAAATVCMR